MWSTFITAPVDGVAPQHIHLLPYLISASIRSLRHSYEAKKAFDAGLIGFGLGVGLMI